MNRIEQVQQYLAEKNFDAWIMVDYENRNKTLVSFVGEKMLTRKIFLVIPREGKAYLITHTIDTVFLNEPDVVDNFDLHVYKTWKEMLAIENNDFKDYKRVIMDVSKDGLLPRVSLADYGSVEFIKNLGIEVESSGDILQRFSALYDEDSYKGQVYACKKALEIKTKAFNLIKELILKNGETDEYTIQQFICDEFHKAGMEYDDPAIVAINTNASNPHYGPTKAVHSKIHEGDVVLIDMWAKPDKPNGVYADITWMGYVGKEVPQVVEDRFQVLRRAVDTGFKFLQDNLGKRRVEGYEVDDVVRSVVEEAGYGQFFTHRTGHNIAVDVSPHGPGVNIDNYESHDTREIIPGVTFSLEPGIYAPDFGMRCETDVYIDSDNKPVMIAGRQEHVIAILK